MGKRRTKSNRQPIPKRNNQQQSTRRNSGTLCCRRCLADAKTSFVYWNPKNKSWDVRCMKCGHTHPINTYGKQFIVFKTVSGGFYAPPDDDAPVFSGQNVTDIYFAGSKKELSGSSLSFLRAIQRTRRGTGHSAQRQEPL